MPTSYWQHPRHLSPACFGYSCTRSRGTSYCLFLISITITRYAQYYVGQWHYLACSKYFRKETRGLKVYSPFDTFETPMYYVHKLLCIFAILHSIATLLSSSNFIIPFNAQPSIFVESKMYICSHHMYQ